MAAVALLVGMGCANDEAGPDGTPGEEGKVDFSYRQGCFFGCPLEQPLLAGTRQVINVSDAGDAQGVKVKSSDPSVAEFALERACFCERLDNESVHVDVDEDAECEAAFRKHCDNTVLVQANAAGESELALRDKSGALIDRVQVRVREAARARIEASYPDKLGAEETSELDLAVGDKVQLEAKLYDEDGMKLLATDGVLWSVEDASVTIVTAWLVGSGEHVNAGLNVEVEGKAAGDTKLTISVPGLDETLDVAVKDE